MMHEGYWSTVLGLPGWPRMAEEIIVARDALLSEATGTAIHCQHLSAAGSVRILREAQSRGVRLSGEVCPHHIALTYSAPVHDTWRHFVDVGCWNVELGD